MKALSLFSGIGGLDLAAAYHGFDIIAQVEIDKFCQAVLKKHKQYWPNAQLFEDIREFGRHNIDAQTIDLVFGGFPCQPFSIAGKQHAENDPRNLWPETRRIIGEFQPHVLILENVKGILQKPQETSALKYGYLGVVLRDLSALGYDAIWQTLSARDIGAPHQRDRVFIVAYPHSPRLHPGRQEHFTARNEKREATYKKTKWQDIWAEAESSHQIMANATSKGSQGIWERRSESQITTAGDTERQPTKPELGRVVNGIPRWLDRHQFPAGQGEVQYSFEPTRSVENKISNRSARIKALGNAVVPQVALPVMLLAKIILRTLETL